MEKWNLWGLRVGLRETNGIFGGGAQSGEEVALRKGRAKDALKGFGSPVI